MFPAQITAQDFPALEDALGPGQLVPDDLTVVGPPLTPHQENTPVGFGDLKRAADGVWRKRIIRTQEPKILSGFWD